MEILHIHIYAVPSLMLIVFRRRIYVEEDGPLTKKLYIHIEAEHEGTYTCSGVLEGNLQSKTVHLDLFSEFFNVLYLQICNSSLRSHLECVLSVVREWRNGGVVCFAAIMHGFNFGEGKSKSEGQWWNLWIFTSCVQIHLHLLFLFVLIISYGIV